MHIVVWSGAALTLVGVLGLLWCIWIVLGIKRANLPDDEARARMQKVVTLNLGALAVSFLGLMAVLVGVILS